jgi:hypothetical protein
MNDLSNKSKNGKSSGSDLSKFKIDYLLSISDVIDVAEAANTVGTWFTKVEKSFYKFAVKNKPKYKLEKYICFHKDLKYGVYQDEGRFYFVSIMRPKKFLGIESEFTIQVVSEILTDKLDDADLEKSAIRGATLLRRDTNSEKNFFQAVIDYDKHVIDLIAKEEIAELEKKREEEKKRKAYEERKAEEKRQAEAARKAEEERLAEEKRQAEAARRAEEKKKKIALLKEKYGENIAKEFEAGRIAIGMPISYVEDIWGSGHDRKRNVSKDGEIIKEKFGKYHKKDGRTGKKSSKTYYKLEVEFERNEKGNSWLVTGFRDL